MGHGYLTTVYNTLDYQYEGAALLHIFMPFVRVPQWEPGLGATSPWLTVPVGPIAGCDLWSEKQRANLEHTATSCTQ